MSAKPLPDLDLNLPFHDGPLFPPPRLNMEEYMRLIEFSRQVLIDNGKLETVIANRSRPSEEMFVLK